jgi:CubicO group peptidase (beta-lactamase class C family)
MKQRAYFKMFYIVVLAVFVFVSGTVPAWAADPGPTDPAELEAFLDDLIQAQMEDLYVPGVTVSVVKDGALFFSKGYGYTDVEKGIAVDAETSLFRIGSGSKLFTWTAVMQLMEQGKLDLDADVNTYLDFEIPATYPEPITMKHLMSHSAGFEDVIFEMLAPSPEKSARGTQNVPLGEWLATHIPARVYRPGETSGYSNYGTALAGYIVQIIAGMPYEQYIQEHIFDPLEMTQSTAYQPVQPEFAPHLATGYMYANDAYQAQAFEHFNVGPAGSISASATDIAKFMLAHLQDGQLGDAQILEPATAQQMHSTLFTNDPRLNGIAYGFIEGSQNGQWIISHAGSTVFLKANLVLLPDQNVGIFIAGNSVGADSLRYTVVEAFIDRYYPAPDVPAPQPLTGVDLSRFVGGYRTTRSSYTKMAKAAYLLQPIDVGATADGYLTFGDQQFMPIEPLLFQEVGGQEKLAFRQDAEGNITHVFQNSHPIWAYEKQVGLASTSLQHTIILFCLAICLLTLVIWLIGAFINRRKEQTQPQLARVARWVIAGMTLLTVAVIAVAFKDVFSPIVSKLPLMRGEIPSLLFVPTLATLAAVLASGAVVLAGLAWKRGYWTVAGRIHYTLVALAGLVFAWWFNFWNLIGWKF